MRASAAKGLVNLIVLYLSSDEPNFTQLELAAKYIVDDIVRATTQAQTDCLTKGLEKR
jgi:hypothetical protein